jgi:hypothetical protein
LEKAEGATMNELINQIAQRTGIGEEKARQAAEAAISFLKTKFPGISGQLDSALQGGGVAEKAGGMTEKLKEGLEGVFGKKTA